MSLTKLTLAALIVCTLYLPTHHAFAADEASAQAEPNTATPAKKEVQDMSDPLAVFTQVGAGFTNKGLNLKVGQTYDTHNPKTAAMNVLEVKGIAGEQIGWTGNSSRDDSIDSLRWRNFKVDLTKFRASQIDINYNVDGNPLVAKQTADASYSMIQALPKFGPIQLYPLAGAGISIGEDAIESDGDVDGGFSTMGIFGVVGMYSKIEITDKMWINYNPMWLTTIAGDDNYEDNYYGKGHSNVFTHEFAVSYQISPRFNVRYFANWSNHTDFLDGDQRIEFNYQI